MGGRMGSPFFEIAFDVPDGPDQKLRPNFRRPPDPLLGLLRGIG
jgi:hypothetical protein